MVRTKQRINTKKERNITKTVNKCSEEEGKKREMEQHRKKVEAKINKIIQSKHFKALSEHYGDALFIDLKTVGHWDYEVLSTHCVDQEEEEEVL